MAIDFPDEPEVDEEFTVDNKTWIYDGAKWSLAGSASTFNQSIDDLSDVALADLADGQVLKYDSVAGVWENGLGATNLDDLTDVAIDDPAEDQILSYNGTAWVNASAPETGTTVQKGNNMMTYLIMEVNS